jgi:sugar phosphate isomerase/epimerase
MNKIGIRAHDIGKLKPEEFIEIINDFGFDGLQLVFKKALSTVVDFNNLELIKNAFKDTKIMMLGAYFNPVHPDKNIVREGVEYFKKHLKIANELSADFVGSETGSLMGSPWGYLPENHKQETLNEVINIFKELSDYAEKCNSKIAIEGAYAHVAYSPQKVKEVLKAINSNNLKVTVDLYNYLHIGNYENRMEIFEDCFKYLKDDIVIFHLKDFVVEDDKLKQVGLGQGLMDYPTIIKRIKQETPEAYLIFEGVTGEDILTSIEYIKRLLKEE